MGLENFEGVTSHACSATGPAISYSSVLSIAPPESPRAWSCDPAACTAARSQGPCGTPALSECSGVLYGLEMKAYSVLNRGWYTIVTNSV